jgi:7-carboxy-7-deazaguanine synthase
VIDQEYLRVTEIFRSIQGESTWTGLPCTFVRLTGCPLRCVWCDTEYSFHGGEKVSLEGILRQVDDFGCRLVEITGGEPLIHPNAFRLATELLEGGFTVLVETSGAIDVGPLDPRAHKIMDLKCPGSGEESKNLWSNLAHLTDRDEVKFVLKDRVDYDWACDVIRDRGLSLRATEGRLRALLFSPVWGELDLGDLSEWMLEDGLPVRLQIQLHKLLWDPDARGV